MNNNNILSLQNVKVYFPLVEGFFKKTTSYVKAVDGVSFDIKTGETLGLVGESGSGKTTLSRSILGLVDEAYDYKDTSKILIEDENILEMKKDELKNIRKKVQIIFQDPFSSLNPRMSVGKIIEEALLVNNIGKKIDRPDMVKDIMNKVGINPDYFNRYPHEFSGGQRQRIGIARALIIKPKLIVADEPVSALDVSIQVQILKLMQKLRDELNLTYLFVAHDLSVVDYFCDRIAVMYLGKIMEIGETKKIVSESSHPYTKALLSAVPIPDPKYKKKQILLGGDIPSPINPPKGCVFHTRCPSRFEPCDKEIPPEIELSPGHKCSCWLHVKNKAKSA